MGCAIDRLITGGTRDAVDTHARTAPATGGFSVLTEIDVAATIKKKSAVKMPACLIPGVCNPQTAWQAIGIEPRAAAMLRCNVIQRVVGAGVGAVVPVSSMQVSNEEQLHAVAGRVRDLIARAVTAI